MNFTSTKLLRFFASASILGLTLVLVLVGVTSAGAGPTCLPVVGRVVDQASTGPSTSHGRMVGVLRGDYYVTATGSSPASSSYPSIEFFTGESRLETRRGNLYFFESSGLDTAEQDGINGAALLTIVDGDGFYSGATGHLSLSGYFHGSTGTGEWRYVGQVCRP